MALREIALTTLFLLVWHHNTLLLWQYSQQNRRKRSRRWWVRPVNRLKRLQGFQHNLYKDLFTSDHEEFYAATRMWPEQFALLHDLVRPFLKKRSCRRPLSVSTRLAITLSFLAQGDSVRSKHLEFRIGKSTAHKIIPETCRAISSALLPQYLPEMKEDDWKAVADGFFKNWQFPNCVGAIDGRHMRIQKPPLSGSNYYNYKGFFSMVLMAACDADYKFTWVDIGQYGSISDGGVWSNSAFGMDLEAGIVDLPQPSPLPNRDVPFPYVFVGDEAFPLKAYLMRPYGRSTRSFNDEERVFNYRLSRARRVIENTFGILTSRWQILNKPLCCSQQNAENIFLALVCPHNFIMKNQQNLPGGERRYCPPDYTDLDDEEDGSWRVGGVSAYFKQMGRVGSNNCGSVPAGMRNYLKQYFLSPTGIAQAPWQFDRALRGREINEPHEIDMKGCNWGNDVFKVQSTPLNGATLGNHDLALLSGWLYKPGFPEKPSLIRDRAIWIQ